MQEVITGTAIQQVVIHTTSQIIIAIQAKDDIVLSGV